MVLGVCSKHGRVITTSAGKCDYCDPSYLMQINPSMVYREAIAERDAEIARLHAIIEAAPHSQDCAGWHGHPEWGNLFRDDCDCWKKDALT